MSKDQYEIGQINCIALHHGAADWMGCFLGLTGQVFFIGGGYGCCL
ncbi:hypothetical protein [Bartonella tribocorum]|nr:hypothetical protein [Bartonella tribocorum]CDO49384.1 hypothetical protein BM1374166_01730 [Bartonella tribocorum]